MQQGEGIADGDAETHFLSGVIELVGEKRLEDLAAALLLAPAPCRLALGGAGLIEVLEAPEEVVLGAMDPGDGSAKARR